MYFEPHIIKQLTDEYSTINAEYARLLSEYTSLSFENKTASEYASQGFMRRIGTLKKCIQNVYTLYPPDKTNKPSNEDRLDIEINLQSFVFNVFGCLDNLAWIWVKEKQLKNKKGEPLGKGSIGLMLAKKNQIVRESFSQEFQDCLNSLNLWHNNLENFRHALAHRIPLYVPPFSLTPEESRQFGELERQKYEALQMRDFKRCNQLIPISFHLMSRSKEMR
ncbi:MAG: hypothetical protein KAI61_06585 [Alphaproteobacteria bacterium]|nr:hypothetical protein [Alphaproteobacteria bacterium]